MVTNSVDISDLCRVHWTMLGRERLILVSASHAVGDDPNQSLATKAKLGSWLTICHELVLTC